ncbi:MAG: pyrroline-5-carboxylate reductase [Gammaproteobacteria bacterium]
MTGNPTMRITFIGGGNMATALITGLARRGPITDSVRVCDPDAGVRERLAGDFGIRGHAGPQGAVEDADMVVLAVKPQVMSAVLGELAGRLGPEQLVLSVAAGITTNRIRGALGGDRPVVRAMPNTPALRGAGVTGLYASSACGERHRAAAEEVLGAAGETVWVDDEALMDAVTAISGSGPAYFYLLAEALREAGAALGLPPETANLLARATAHGAGVMLHEEDADAAEDGGFRKLVLEAARAAERRGRELAEDEA